MFSALLKLNTTLTIYNLDLLYYSLNLLNAYIIDFCLSLLVLFLLLNILLILDHLLIPPCFSKMIEYEMMRYDGYYSKDNVDIEWQFII